MRDFFDAKSDISLPVEPLFQRVWKKSLHWLEELFVQHIPVDSIKEMQQKEEVYFFGALAYILAISIYVLLTVRFFLIVVNQAYISLDNSTGNCFTIPITISNSFLADSKGHWVGMFGFEYYDAMYSLQLSGFNISSMHQFAQMMDSFRAQLQSRGELAQSRNLAYNLLLWTNFVAYYSLEYPSIQNFSALSQGKLQSFEMTGKPKQVFDMRFQKFTMASKFGYCFSANSAVFSKQDGIISSSLALLSPSCMSMLSVPLATTDLSVGLEVESFTTAMAANMGIVKKYHLTIAQNLQSSIKISHNNSAIIFDLNEYFDLRYPTMTPVMCLSNTTQLPTVLAQLSLLCFVVVPQLSTIALPVFNHMGYNLTNPTYCECGGSTATHEMRSACNKFNLLSGLIYFNDGIEKGTSRPQREYDLLRKVKRLIHMVLQFENYESFNRAAYFAMAASGIAASGSPDDDDDKTAPGSSSQVLDDAFKFCDLSLSSPFIISTAVPHNSSNFGGDVKSTTITNDDSGYSYGDDHCVLLLFHSFDNFSNQVSDFHFPLRNGSCSDSFNLDDEKWQQLLHNAPVKFYESYFSCLPDRFSALQMASGSAWSNLSLALPFLVFACVPLLRILLRRWSCLPATPSLASPSLPEYSKEEMQRASNMLALQLLRCRDGKHLNSTDCCGHMDIWEQLLEEMKRANYSSRRKSTSVAGVRVLGLHRRTFTQSTDTGEPDSDEDLEDE